MNDFPYEDIVNLTRPQSGKHPCMSLHDRAAQFASFAALTGYDDIIHEEGRHTEDRLELDEEQRAQLDRRLQFLSAHLQEGPTVKIRHFVPDRQKKGGCYVQTTGRIQKISAVGRHILLESSDRILLENIVKIDILPQDSKTLPQDD